MSRILKEPRANYLDGGTCESGELFDVLALLANDGAHCLGGDEHLHHLLLWSLLPRHQLPYQGLQGMAQELLYPATLQPQGRGAGAHVHPGLPKDAISPLALPKSSRAKERGQVRRGNCCQHPGSIPLWAPHSSQRQCLGAMQKRALQNLPSFSLPIFRTPNSHGDPL
jgi:hypothetical protein